VDFLMMIMKITKPPGIKKFDEETEAKYRTKVGDCNNQSKFLYTHQKGFYRHNKSGCCFTFPTAI
jgi:hypothetical protein